IELRYKHMKFNSNNEILKEIENFKGRIENQGPAFLKDNDNLKYRTNLTYGITKYFEEQVGNINITAEDKQRLLNEYNEILIALRDGPNSLHSKISAIDIYGNSWAKTICTSIVNNIKHNYIFKLKVLDYYQGKELKF
ncbi:MAG: hypothetical protein V4580_06735, partial [Bacteroidota bacterium]